MTLPTVDEVLQALDKHPDLRNRVRGKLLAPFAMTGTKPPRCPVCDEGMSFTPLDLSGQGGPPEDTWHCSHCNKVLRTWNPGPSDKVVLS